MFVAMIILKVHRPPQNNVYGHGYSRCIPYCYRNLCYYYWRQLCYLLIILLIVHVDLSQLMQDKEFGETALIAASGQGHIKCATILLNHRANVNYQRKVRLLYVE